MPRARSGTTLKTCTSLSSRTRTRSPSRSWTGCAARASTSIARRHRRAARSKPPPADLVLLDLRLPDIDGLDVCRRLRERSRVPIIVVTARGEEADRVVGLELGADDYVVKPYGLRELIARIRAVTRRTAVARPERRAAAGRRPRGRRARAPRRPRRPRARADAEGVRPARRARARPGRCRQPASGCSTRSGRRRWYGSTKTIDVHVAALRKKLGDPGWIETVRGVGFRLRAP